MAELTIGDVEELTGVKAHVLRYWEENIPLLLPRKDLGGRRLYSARDVQLVFRLKYLIQTLRFTVAGAGEQLLEEAAKVPANEALRLIRTLKTDLIELYGVIRSRRENAGSSPE